MNVGIIGTGNMGSGLGKWWANAGHKILFGSRDPQKAKALAQSIGPNAEGGAIPEAAGFGEAVLLAVNWANVPEAIEAAGSLEGKILIDCTNPLTPDYMTCLVGFTTSGAEEIAKWAKGAKVVKAFNHIHARVMHTGAEFGAERADVFFCGDDPPAKAAVADLIRDAGFNPVDSGPLQNARYIEPMTELLVQLAYAQGMGDNQALKIMRR